MVAQPIAGTVSSHAGYVLREPSARSSTIAETRDTSSNGRISTSTPASTQTLALTIPSSRSQPQNSDINRKKKSVRPKKSDFNDNKQVQRAIDECVLEFKLLLATVNAFPGRAEDELLASAWETSTNKLHMSHDLDAAIRTIVSVHVIYLLLTLMIFSFVRVRLGPANQLTEVIT